MKPGKMQFIKLQWMNEWTGNKTLLIMIIVVAIKTAASNGLGRNR